MSDAGRSALVTGAAGFVGSWTVQLLLERGWSVTGVDALTDYYDRAQKLDNLGAVRDAEAFELVEGDLCDLELERLLDGVEVVIHLAGQPGVRASWGRSFEPYLDCNVRATQRLLEAARETGVERLVYASSSSVYGQAERYPTVETDRPQPVSPYGVTKLAGEHLCTLYARAFGVHTVSLRYFTVFGPRQRPDMAMHRMFEAALDGTPFPVFGDGSQVRDFTFVADVVDANVRAATMPVPPGTVMNVGGGSGITLSEVITIVEDVTGATLALDRHDPMPGDPARTGADTSLARSILDWTPRTGVRDGLALQAEWHMSRRGATRRAR